MPKMSRMPKMSKMSQPSNGFSVLQNEDEDETNEVFQPIFLDASNVLHSESLEVTDSDTGIITKDKRLF